MIKHLLSTCVLLLFLYPCPAQITPAVDSVWIVDSAYQDIRSELQEHIPTITLSDEEMEEGGNATVSSILTAGRDPFLAAAAFNFSVLRFRLRGYESHGDAIFINGIEFNGLENGYVPYSLWGGLNNVMRMQQNAYGLQANEFTFGALALNTNVDLRAAAQRVQTQIGYALSNRNYRHRVTLNHASGFNKKGWAYSFALTGRYAPEGYIPGTYYESASYYVAVDKRINPRNTFSFIAFGAPTEVGRQGASVQEAMNLAGTNYYNPSWGWQGSKKRNANVLQGFQPVFIAMYEHRPHEKVHWLTNVAYLFGKRKTSALDWYNAPDPRPDYYRYLPSYYMQDNPALYVSLYSFFINNPDALQIQWEKLYEANRGNLRTIPDVEGIPGNDITGNRSVYILSNRVNDQQRIIANTIYNLKLSSISTFTGGASYQQQINHYYQEVKDLLGGDFWVNINQFVERDYPNNIDVVQHDLDRPNRLVKEGEQYGYNYKITLSQAALWAQLLFVFKKLDVFAAGKISQTAFFRTGFNRNGLFPESSYGKSSVQNFFNPAVKAGVTYKMNGRNYFFINGTYRTIPPFFENAYISQRTRNDVQEGLKSETIISGEAGYKLSAPRVKLSITGYYTKNTDGVDVLSFYHDQYQSFVNYALSGIDKVYFGGELGAEIKLSSTVSFNGAASVGSYYYDSRPRAIITADNSAAMLGKQTIYLKNYRIASSPQQAYSAGFFYRSPKFWYASITANYFQNMWLSLNPIRRTAEAIADTEPDNPVSEAIKQSILAQERFEDVFTIDLFGGWNKLLHRKYYIKNRRTYLLFTVGVNNLLNNRNLKSGGFEQLRLDFEEKNVNKFPPKYYYAYGINFFASIGLRF